MLNSIHYLQYRLGQAEPITHTTEAERACLKRFAMGRHRLAEIGVFHGVNTRMFRAAMADDGVILAIDPFPRAFFGIRGFGWARRIAHREVGLVEKGAVVWIEAKGSEAPSLSLVRKHLPVDFIFIDGDHSWEGIESDWLAWRSQVSEGGFVCLHDSRNCHSGSVKYATEVIERDPDFQVVETIDTLTVLRRIGRSSLPSSK